MNEVRESWLTRSCVTGWRARPGAECEVRPEDNLREGGRDGDSSLDPSLQSSTPPPNEMREESETPQESTITLNGTMEFTVGGRDTLFFFRKESHRTQVEI